MERDKSSYVEQCAMVPFKVGILGYGNLRTMSTDKWATYKVYTTFNKNLGQTAPSASKCPKTTYSFIMTWIELGVIGQKLSTTPKSKLQQPHKHSHSLQLTTDTELAHHYAL